MASKTIRREEFDTRLAQSTEQVRQKRLTLEAQAAGQVTDTSAERRDALRNHLTELAERTSLVAASL